MGAAVGVITPGRAGGMAARSHTAAYPITAARPGTARTAPMAITVMEATRLLPIIALMDLPKLIGDTALAAAITLAVPIRRPGAAEWPIPAMAPMERYTRQAADTTSPPVKTITTVPPACRTALRPTTALPAAVSTMQASHRLVGNVGAVLAVPGDMTGAGFHGRQVTGDGEACVRAVSAAFMADSDGSVSRMACSDGYNVEEPL